MSRSTSDRRGASRAGARLAAAPQGAGMPLVARAREADHDARAFLRFYNRLARRTLAGRSLAELRRSWRLLALALGRRVSVASVSERTIRTPAGPISLRIFRPDHASSGLKPALLWCHGGGFVLGSLDSADSICRNLARRTGAVVVAVGYRLASEHGLHAGREDFLAALRWVATHGASLGIDASRLAVGGDSASGNIAAAVAQQVAREGGPALCLQLLAYPATDLHRDFPSKAENARGHLLTAEFIDWSKSLFAGSLDLADPWLSPARSADLRGLPPALIVSAGFDPIRDDGLAYAARLRDAGVPVELLHYPGQFHGFLNFDSVIGAARDALERAGRSLAGAFAAEAAPDRTLEVGDAPARQAQPLREAARQWAGATLMAWSGLEQWNDALLRLVSPGMAATAALWLQPWLMPAAWARHGAIACLQRLEARQTHPTTAD